ncbi:MAG: TonB-dependent receptor plug domain-containing protein [Pseudomonas sp.]
MRARTHTGLFFLLLPVAAIAEPATYQLQPVIVSAEWDGRNANSNSSVATAIDRSTIEQQPAARNLGDVINRMPGVFMGGPPGENNDIRLRGLDKEFTRFELDGAQLPGSGEKREFEVNRLSPFAIGEVTIVRNPTAKYESDGIAGRVQARSREIPQGRMTQARVYGGGAGDLDGRIRGINLFHGQRLNQQFGFNLFADYDQQQVFKDKTVKKFDGAGLLRDSESEQEAKPTDTVNLMADLAWFYDQGEVHFRPLFNRLEENKDKEKIKTNFVNNQVEIEQEQEDKTQTTRGVQLQHVHRFFNQVELASGLQYYETLEEKDKTKPRFRVVDSTRVLNTTELEEESKQDDILQLDMGLTIPFMSVVPQSLETGVRVRERNRFRDKSKLEVRANGSIQDKGEAKDNYELEERYFAWYLQNDLLATERLTATPGIRLERVERTSRSGTGEVVERSFNEVNPHLHISYEFNDQLTAFGAISRTINMPKFDEVSPYIQEKGDRFTLGNPALEPARSVNTDIGLRWQQGSTELMATAFHKRITGLIEEVDTGSQRDGKDIYQVENVGDGRLDGLELEARAVDALPGLTPWGNISFIHSAVTDSSGSTRRFREQPNRIANLGFDYRFAPTGTSMSFAGKYVGESEKTDANKREVLSSQWFLDIGLRQEMADGVFLTADALNVLNTEKNSTTHEQNGRVLSREASGAVYMIGFEATF